MRWERERRRIEKKKIVIRENKTNKTKSCNEENNGGWQRNKRKVTRAFVHQATTKSSNLSSYILKTIKVLPHKWCKLIYSCNKGNQFSVHPLRHLFIIIPCSFPNHPSYFYDLPLNNIPTIQRDECDLCDVLLSIHLGSTWGYLTNNMDCITRMEIDDKAIIKIPQIYVRLNDSSQIT